MRCNIVSSSSWKGNWCQLSNGDKDLSVKKMPCNQYDGSSAEWHCMQFKVEKFTIASSRKTNESQAIQLEDKMKVYDMITTLDITSHDKLFLTLLEIGDNKLRQIDESFRSRWFDFKLANKLNLFNVLTMNNSTSFGCLQTCKRFESSYLGAHYHDVLIIIFKWGPFMNYVKVLSWNHFF